jgi:hypothetical protein
MNPRPRKITEAAVARSTGILSPPALHNLEA